MSNGVTASILFDDIAVIRRGTKEKNSIEAREKIVYSAEDLKKLRYKQAIKKQKRREEEIISEKVQIEKDWDTMKRIAIMNNAGIRHIELFARLIKHAKDNELGVTIIEMRKRLKPEEAVREWQTIKNWCGKNAPKICALTIGRKPKGWWSLRVLVVGGKEDEDCYKPALALHSYLMLKRGWITSDHAGSNEAKNLEEHYLTRLSKGEEAYDHYVTEIYEVYRASLRLPKSTRTFRTKEASNILQRMEISVDDGPASVVNGVGAGVSPSGVALCRVIMENGRVVGAKRIGVVAYDDEEDGWFMSGDESLLPEDF